MPSALFHSPLQNHFRKTILRRIRSHTTQALLVCAVASALLSESQAQLGDIGNTPAEAQISLVPEEQIPPAPALSAEEALTSFKLPLGYKLEIAASDPLVQDPVAITFGPDGRMWVVEMRSYMADIEGIGETNPIGRIVVLSDRNGDGRYDHSEVFLDGLVMPRAIALVADGVLVGEPPELAFWRDTDGDGRADQKTVVTTDYGLMIDPQRPHLSNPEAAPNGLLWAHDNWIYSAAYTKKIRYAKGEWTTQPTSYRGQWGLSQDDWGRFYHSTNSSHLRVDVIKADYLTRNPHFPRLAGSNVIAPPDQQLWPARVTPGVNRGYQQEVLRDGRLRAFTAACGPWIYRGDLLPELHGNAFAAEPAANLVRRSILSSENGSITARNAYTQDEFLTSQDERFRPVNFATGPDGALYIVDLYRGILQHRIAITSYLRKQIESRQLEHPQHLGRIYRLVRTESKPPRMTQIAPLSNQEWVDRLSHPNAWWRETAQRLLVERADTSILPALRNVAHSSASPDGRIHALWVLDGIDAMDTTLVLAALSDQSAKVQMAGLRLAEPWLRAHQSPEITKKALELARSGSPEVGLQAVLSLGEAGDAAIDLQLAETVQTRPDLRFGSDAFFSGIQGREFALFERLIAKAVDRPSNNTENPLIGGLIRGIVLSRNTEHVTQLLDTGSTLLTYQRALAEMVIETTLSTAATLRRPLVLVAQPPSWPTLEADAVIRTRLNRVKDKVLWPNKTGMSSTALPRPLTSEEQQRFAEGQTLYTALCAGCHQPNGLGLDGVAPQLADSEWVVGDPDRLVRIILHGVRGPITVAGRMHNGEMPALGGVLDDAQLSAIATYVRRAWDHGAGPIPPKTVKTLRKRFSSRQDGWTARELMQPW